MKKLILAAAILFSPLAIPAPQPTWGPACTEWHFSPDNFSPLVVWSANTYPYGTCFSDRDWTQQWSGMTEPNHCNPPPGTAITVDLTQMGVASDAKVAIFEGIIIGTPSGTVANDTAIAINFCAPSYNCDLTRQVVYSISQGGTVVAIGARAPTSIHAPVEGGKIKYAWRVWSNPYTASDEYYGVSLQMRGWCR